MVKHFERAIDAATALYSAALGVLPPNCPNPVVKRPRIVRRFEGNGSTDWTDWAEDWLEILQRAKEDVRELPAFDLAAQAWRRVRDEPPEWPLLGFLDDALQQYATEAQPSLLAELARRHVHAWHTKRYRGECVLLVAGIAKAGDEPEVEFAPDMRLLSATDEDKTDYWNEGSVHFSLFGPPDPHMVLSAGFLLKAHEDLDEGGWLRRSRYGRDQCYRAVSTLRLLLPGTIGAPYTRRRVVPKPHCVPGSALSGPEPCLGMGHWSEANASLGRLEKDQVAKVYRRLEQVPRPFELALRRFNQSYERLLDEDAIIDLAIALEATILHGVQDELTFRLQLLAATLLGDATPAGHLRELYKARSKIVHEGSALSEVVKQSPRDFVELTRRTVAMVLLMYLERLETDPSVRSINDALMVEAFAGAAAGLMTPTH